MGPACGDRGQPRTGAQVAMSDDLDALFRLHHRELRQFAYRDLRCSDSAGDVVQDTFLRYATVLSRPDAPGLIANPRAFLWRIATNILRDHRARLCRRGFHARIDDCAETQADPRPGADQRIEARQRLARLRMALAELPPDCRTALLLSRLDGRGHQEIAQCLGISASMVSKHIMRALRHCVRRLAAA